uniref:Putative vasotocin-neurophysin n=1 Tax=Tityus obscurus TaxID=1221240 RepID=A0A1E1WVS0_TITOB
MHSLLFFAMLIVLTNACYITNCPPGGKRNVNIIKRNSCGLAEENKCSIRGLCCGSTIGCLINEEGIPICQQPFHYHLCRIYGRICSLDGICIGNGICCVKDNLCTMKTENTFMKNNLWKKTHSEIEKLSTRLIYVNI